MNHEDDNLPFEAASRTGTRELADALDVDAAQRLSAPTPDVPGAFVGAVTRRRRARVAVRVAAVAVPVVVLAVVAGVMLWPVPAQSPVQQQVVNVPSGERAISPAPTAAELARVNRGRSGEGLVLPESGGAGGGVITAGTRVDSPAAAQVVR